jgi:hypothetical protein
MSKHTLRCAAFCHSVGYFYAASCKVMFSRVSDEHQQKVNDCDCDNV